jgi:hypothetical protein
LDDKEEDNKVPRRGSLGRGQQNSRRKITMKWMTKIRKRVVELKDDNHKEEGSKAQG